MTFKDIKPDYKTYHLLKTDGLKAYNGRVVSVSGPRFQNPTNIPVNPFSQTNTQVVDVTIELNGEQKTYTIPENLEVTYAGSDHVISVDKDNILREVESIKTKTEEMIRNTDKNKKILEDCNAIMVEWNPAFKEKKENDERFGKIETEIKSLASSINSLLTKLT